MSPKIPRTINALEFVCQAPLRFYEHCTSCPRFSDSCPDLALGKEILRGKKKITYRNKALESEIQATAFNCLAPLYYFEKSRVNCGHVGRCREEGLLLALLDGKKKIDYSQRPISELPHIRRQKVSRVAKSGAKKAVAS
jgi:hypothetical protein